MMCSTDSVPARLEASLQAAVRASDVPGVTELVRSGADVNHLSLEGLTPPSLSLPVRTNSRPFAELSSLRRSVRAGL